MFNEICQTDGCSNKATRLAAKPEGGIIDICSECWHKMYKI